MRTSSLHVVARSEDVCKAPHPAIVTNAAERWLYHNAKLSTLAHAIGSSMTRIAERAVELESERAFLRGLRAGRFSPPLRRAA